MQPIRYSPSGPVIQNLEGGEAIPGEGFRLRLINKTQEMTALAFDTALQNIPVSGGGDLFLTLPNPAPNKRYKVRCIAQIETFDDGAFACQGGFGWQIDNGVQVNGADLFKGARGTLIDVADTQTFDAGFCWERAIQLGANLPAPVVSGSVALTVYAMVSGSSNVRLQDENTAYLELEEML